MFKRIALLVFIFFCSSLAWGVFSLVMHQRSTSRGERGQAEVGMLWGSEHTQVAPSVKVTWQETRRTEMTPAEKAEHFRQQQRVDDEERSRLGLPFRRIKLTPEEYVRTTEVEQERELPLASSNIQVALGLDQRKRGLFWYSTYAVDFSATYVIENPLDRPVLATLTFPYPATYAIYDDLRVQAAGREDLGLTSGENQLVGQLTLPPGGRQVFTYGYRSRGMDRWGYRFGHSVKLVNDFRLTLRTDFDEIDFAPGSISPDTKQARAGTPGWELAWVKKSLVSGLEVGLVTPHRLNPGPLAASLSAHAPISLFFFFFVVFLLQARRPRQLHAMNYFFLACSFFAFNLLFGYLVDHVELFPAFLIAAGVSLLLVVSYLLVVAGPRLALFEAAFAQLVYQGLFSAAHFLEGFTGLTITVGAIVTLAVVMHLTARTDWTQAFATRKPTGTAPQPSATIPG